MIKSSTRKCVADHHATVPLSRATTSNTSYLTMRQARWSLVDTHMSLVALGRALVQASLMSTEQPQLPMVVSR